MSTQKIYHFLRQNLLYLLPCGLLLWSSSTKYIYVSSYKLSLLSQVYAKSRTSAEEIQYAQNLQIKGRRLLKRKKYREALKSFQESHRQVPDIKNLVIIGAIHVKLDQCQGAFNAWQSALKMCAGCQRTQEIKTKISKYTTQCSSTVEVNSRPRAHVNIDGIFVGKTPYRGRLLVGKHQLKISAVGYDPIHRVSEVQPYQPIKIDVDLIPAGQLLGQSPYPSPKVTPTLKPIQQALPPQNHPQSQLNRSNRVHRSKPILTMISPAIITPTYQNDLNDQVQIDPHMSLRRGLWLTTVILGIGAGGAYYYSSSEHKDLTTLSTRPSVGPNPELHQRANRAKMFQTTSGVMFALSATSLITSFFFLE